MSDLMIYNDVQNEALRLLLDKIEQQYGCILTNTGGIVEDKWISPKAITVLVHELDKELREKNTRQGCIYSEYAKLKQRYFGL